MSSNKNKNKNPIQQKTYAVKIVYRDGVACVSIVGSGLHYSTNGQHEPYGKIFKGFHETKQKRGRILVKLGIWESGQNSKQLKKQE